MGKRVLLVEGIDDYHVVRNLCIVHDMFSGEFEIQQANADLDPNESGGVDKLLAAIPRWLLTSDLERLAIVVDADDKGPERRWEQIRGQLLRAKYGEVSKDLPRNGTIELSLRAQTPRSVRFAVWVMPNNISHGMLEDFVANLVPEDDAMHPLVDSFLDSIPEDKRRFEVLHRAKAWIHSWLAVQEEPGRPMGQAITRKYLDTNREVVEPFLKWITDALMTDGEHTLYSHKTEGKNT